MTYSAILVGVALWYAVLSPQEIPRARTFDQVWTSAEQHRTKGEFQEALRDYREAAGRALQPYNAAKAYFRMGQIFEQIEDPDAAMSCYQSSLERVADTDTQAAIVRLQKDRMGRLVSSSEIVRALRRTATRSQVVTPAIDLHVNFDFNKDTLTVEDRPAANGLPAQVSGTSQVEALARALADPELAHDRFEIDGHTDLIGADAYNVDLSVRRAQRVKDMLVSRLGLDSRRFDIKGFGKQFPLQNDTSESAGRLNRRVSVKHLPAADSPE